MKRENPLDVYYVDDDDIYLNYFRKRFQLDIPYNLHTYNSGKKFLRHFIHDNKWRKNQKIVIFDYLLNSSDDADAKTGMELLPTVKRYSPETDVIMLSGKVNFNVKPTASNYTPVAFIKKDDNAFDHIAATIKKLAAKYDLDRKYRQSRLATQIFIILIIIGILAAILTLLF